MKSDAVAASPYPITKPSALTCPTANPSQSRRRVLRRPSRRHELFPAASNLCGRGPQRRGLRPTSRTGDRRADYFSGGTLVVWDVDLLAGDVVRKYSAGDPEHAVVFRQGEIADAEPAVPGWKMNVDDLFR